MGQSNSVFENFRNHIRAEAVRAAHDRFLLTEQFALVPNWSGKSGGKRSVGFTRAGEPRGGYYSFIVNRTSLLFYVRKPAWYDEWNNQQRALSEWFADLRQKESGEWTVRVSTIADVRFLEDLSRNTPTGYGSAGKDDLVLGSTS